MTLPKLKVVVFKDLTSVLYMKVQGTYSCSSPFGIVRSVLFEVAAFHVFRACFRVMGRLVCLN